MMSIFRSTILVVFVISVFFLVSAADKVEQSQAEESQNIQTEIVEKKRINIMKNKVYSVCADLECLSCLRSKEESKCFCKDHSFLFLAKMKKCPLCRKKLKQIEKRKIRIKKTIAGKMKIKNKIPADIISEPVVKMTLYRNIQVNGYANYDPELMRAEKEFIESTRSLERIKATNDVEAKNEAVADLMAKMERLKSMGLNEEQIRPLKTMKNIDSKIDYSSGKMWIYGDIDSNEIKNIKVGNRMIVKSKKTENSEYRGYVTSINTMINTQSGKVRFRGEVDNVHSILKPEDEIEIIIMKMFMPKKGVKSVYAIPVGSVIDTGLKKIIYLDLGNGEYEAKVVRIGPVTTSRHGLKEGILYYPVLEGLKKNDKIVRKAKILDAIRKQIKVFE